MKRFWANFYLWLHGYCTKHGIPKESRVGPGGVNYFCCRCEGETTEKVDNRLEYALTVLGHTPN